MSGIYFLFINGNLIYIGQSIDVHRRLKGHSITYHTYRIIPCPVDKLLYYEKRLINYFKPELNGHPGGKREGAGRKVGSYQNGEKKEETVVMRIPERFVPIVKEYIKRYHESKELCIPFDPSDLELMAKQLQ
jgi:hypothetical protein